MRPTHATVPVVLVIAGNDPSGGAGMQADIEALASHGCHAAPVITALTVQDTTDVRGLVPTDAELVLRQARCILEDMPVAAIKVGLLGSNATTEAVGELLAGCPDIPVVLDPILRSGAGTTLVDAHSATVLETLLSTVTVLTPNSEEARILAGTGSGLDQCGAELLRAGAEFVLITGTHEDEPRVVNRLYGPDGLIETFDWERLPHSYHGSGCTLASSIAGLLARDADPLQAIHQAQEYTWQTLRHGYRLGHGQHLPNRLFWATRRE